MTDNNQTVRLLITALREEQCTVAFEPEGAVVKLSKEDALTVEISGPGSGLVEVSHLPDGITVGAWSGAATKVSNKAGDPVPV